MLPFRVTAVSLALGLVTLARAELARNHQGKIMRRLIREEILAEFLLVDGPYPVLERR